jgi:(p)ppGpp synthase/HD superfamily hydrolase
MDEIISEFGCYVGNLVSSNTEDKSLSWEERKEHTIKSIPTKSYDAIRLLFADKLSNLRSIKRDYDELGEELWKRFNRGRSHQSWYYVNVYREIVKALSNTNINEKYRAYLSEYRDLLVYVFPERYSIEIEED